MNFLRHIIRVFLILLTVTTAFAQTENELKEQANKLFEKEQYVNATSNYLRLLSLNPKSGDYNFHYGTCLLFNSYQKKDAIRYLNFAVKQTIVDPRAYYFYGKSLHLNYQFDDAIKYYKIYLAKRAKRDNRYQVEREIKMCQDGKKLLTTFTQIIVADKKEIAKDKFYQLYNNMETVGGDILVSADFQSKLDKKKGHVPIVHFPPNAKAIYYASYGDKDDSGKDIYVRRRLPNGKWGNPQMLPGMVNTLEDEDFPFMHSSGDFLFFSSKGHNSMGGYDVFMSRFDPNTNSFKKPENVDFAISSPDDDLFYVVDETFQNAYFASARQSQNGKLHVYNVKVARVPIREVIVMGSFLSEINPENKAMTIDVFNYTNGESVGKIKSNKVGKYSFVFPQGGKYTYEVKVDGKDDVYKFVVELPFLDEFRPLKQKALHTNVDGQEIVKIINLFDEKVEGAEALIAEVIRKKASLDVNIDNFDLNEIDEQQKRNEVLAELGFNNMSMNEVSGQLEELAITEKLRKEKVELIQSNIDAEIVEKAKLIDAFDNQLSAIETKIIATDSPSEKHELINEALNIESERLQLANEINNLDVLKKQAVSTIADDGGNGPIQVLENQFNSLIAANKEEEALTLLSKNKEVLTNLKANSPDAIVNDLIDKSIATSTRITSLKAEELSYEKSISEIDAKIMLLTNSLPDAKKKEYQKTEAKIVDLQSELEVVKEMRDISQNSIDAKNKHLSILDNNIASLQKAMLNEEFIAIDQAEVTSSVREVEDIIQKDKTEQYKQKLLALEKEHPELGEDYTAENNEVPSNNTESNPLIASQVESIENENEDKAGEIESNEQLSELEINQQLLENNQSTEEKINKRLEDVKSELANNPANSSLKEELSQLNELKSDIAEENQSLKQSINELSTSKPTVDVALSPKDVFNEIVSDYTSSIQELKNDNTLSEKDQLINIQEVDKNAVADLVKEQDKLVKEISKDPSNQELTTRNEIVTLLIENKQTEIDERAQTINALSDVSSIIDNSTIKKELETKLNTNYLDEKAAIENSESSEYVKNKELYALSVEQLETLETEEQKIIKESSKKPNDAGLNQKKTVISEIVAAQNSEVNQQKERAIAAISSQEVEIVVNEIDKNYETNVAEIKSKNTVTMNDDLANREVVLQDKLEKERLRVEKELSRKFSVTAELLKTTIIKASTESKQREEVLRSKEPEVVVDNTANREEFINSFRTNSFGGDDNAINASYSTIDELKTQDQILAFYESQLMEEIKTSEAAETDEKTKWLNDELGVIKEKRRQISMSIGELEQESIATTSTETKESFINAVRESAINEQDLSATYSTKKELEQQDAKLENYEQQLTEEIKDTKQELKKDKKNESLKDQLNWLEDELDEVQQKRRRISVSFGELETEIIANNSTNENKTPQEQMEESANKNTALNKQLNQLADNNSDPLLQETQELNTSKKEEIKALIKQSEKSKSVEEKKYILEKAQQELDAVNSLVARTIEDTQRKELEEKNNVKLLTQEELQKRKRRFSIQIGELTTDIMSVENEIEDAKRKEIPLLETRKSALVSERSILEKQLREVESQLLEEEELVSVVSEQAVETELSFNEERKQAGTESYKKYYDLGTDALDTEKQIIELEKELHEARTIVNQLIAENSPENKEEIEMSVEKIKSLSSNIDRLKVELIQKKYLADEALPINPTEAMRMQNLVYRGIKPLKAIAVATLLQMPANGFTMNENTVSSYSEAKPIPVDVESPSGLVYRVQIGAFARPIPQNLYKEFTPVSGEKIEGTNITRYMAGYFNNSSSVVDARRSIRALGYSDAFIVAYCDGKRIGFGDARRREANGTCVPKGSNEMMLEVATKTAENLGLPTTTEIQEVPEYTYNQSPGATDADPIEMMQGLFFTVQIGVFNRPVSDAVVYNLPELSTVRLPNGQIRYNTGIFDSSKEALPRRKDALKRGIVGAFVVAYYQGKRIPLTQARHILSENGEAILQSRMEKLVVEEVAETTPAIEVVRTDSVTIENITPIREEELMTNDRIQIVTKKQFDVFPRDVLNRYNAEGAFYFDGADRRVKSIIYKSENELPRLRNFKDDIDTVYIPFEEYQQFNKKIISVDIEGATIPGDVMDWLLRFPYPREIVEMNTGVHLKIYQVEETEIEKVLNQIRTFGLNPIADEVELELEEYE